MLKRFLTLAVLLSSVLATSAAVRGDVDGSCVVDIDDLNAVINVMLHKNADADIEARADIDGNGMVDIDDLNVVVNVMLGKDTGGTAEPYTYTVNGVAFKMVTVEGGTFTMGATAEQGELYDSDERPTHQVSLSSFAIGATEVTQELWQAVMDSNPSYFTGDPQCPVETVSWNECQTFIAKLNELTGATFRLPTEAEWEYAARGGNKSRGYMFAGSSTLDDVAWYALNSNSTTHAVATKSPNELGIYDMSGNVFEWCQDWYDSYSSDAQTNPTGATWGTGRVTRGGSRLNNEWNCRVSFRYRYEPQNSDDIIGFRLAL